MRLFKSGAPGELQKCELQEYFLLPFHPLSSPSISIIACSFPISLSPHTPDSILQANHCSAQATTEMSTLNYQSISSDGHIPTNQEIGPEGGPFDHHPLEEEYVKSFETTYNSNWLANLQYMQHNDQIRPMSANSSLDNPSNMEPALHFTEPLVDLDLNFSTQTQTDWLNPEAFGEQSMHIPKHVQPAKQPILDFGYQNSNASTNMQYIEQPTASLTIQSSYGPTNTSPLEQHNQAPINHGGNTAGNVLPHGQATQPTIHYGSNLHTNTTLDEQVITAPIQSSSNPQTNIPLDEEATPAPVPSSSNLHTNTPSDEQATPAPVSSSGKGKKKPRTTKKSSSVTTPRKAKHPAVVEDNEIERWAREYDIPYEETRILLDYANARIKGIETSEPEDAPSRYIMSRFEQVRRTHPDHATWPYDLPEEKIIRLLPGQQKQCRAPHKSYQDACEKRRQELDDRYNESRHWEGPPPPKPGQTGQNTLTDPATNTIATGSAAPSNFESVEAATDNIATGLAPLADWTLDSAAVPTNNVRTGLTPPPDFESAEIANDIIAFGSASALGYLTPEEVEASNQMMQDVVQPFDNTTAAPTFDFVMEGVETSNQLQPPPQSFAAPIQPDGLDAFNFSYLPNEPAVPEDIHMAGSVDPAQFPSLLPTFTPGEQDQVNNSKPPPAFDINQIGSLFPPLKITPTEQDTVSPLGNADPPATSDDDDFDSLFDEDEGHPSPPPTSPPAEQDDKKTSTNVDLPAEFDQSQLDYLFEEPLEFINDHEMVQQPEQPAQLPSPPLSTSASTKQDNPDPAASPNSTGVFDQSQLDYLLDELIQDTDVTEMDQQPEEPAQYPSSSPLPTWMPMEQGNTDSFANVDVPVAANDSLYGSMLDEESPSMSGTDLNSLMQFLQERSEEVGGQDLEMEM